MTDENINSIIPTDHFWVGHVNSNGPYFETLSELSLAENLNYEKVDENSRIYYIERCWGGFDKTEKKYIALPEKDEDQKMHNDLIDNSFEFWIVKPRLTTIGHEYSILHQYELASLILNGARSEIESANRCGDGSSQSPITS